ncbi:hypothetical protein LIER_38284 [Lithospermum erythrorhizon]|uniref:Uncharacterized protein n=1 Tax=Lithospermum erythrorhizon TaxID=34254 RepID=A0AAV3PZF7_LITER
MERQMMLIPQIQCGTENWTARITITEDIPILTCSGGLKLKRYIFTDDEGNVITAAIFGYMVPILTPMLELFRVYDITNAQVRFVEPQYRILDNSNQWILQRQTLIQPVSQVMPNMRYFLDGLTPLGLIHDSLISEDQTVDLMSIMLKSEDFRHVNIDNEQTTVQNFKIVDAEMKPVQLTLWGELTSSVGPSLVAASRNHNIVVAKRLKITRTRYGVTSVRAKNSSSFAVDPPVEGATYLKSWFDTVRDAELPQLLEDKSILTYRDMVRAGSIRTYTVAEIQNSTECRDYWIRGLLQLHEEDQKLFYVGCSNCFSKINISDGVQYTCLLCKKEVVSRLRPIVIMSIEDLTGSMEAVATGNVAEQIIQTTSSQIVELMKLGQTYDLHSIKTEFQNKTFLMLLRRTYARRFDAQRRLLLAAYFDEPHSQIASQSLTPDDTSSSAFPLTSPSAKRTPQEISMSPLKRQIAEIVNTTGTLAKKQLMMQPDDKDQANDASTAETESTNFQP